MGSHGASGSTGQRTMGWNDWERLPEAQRAPMERAIGLLSKGQCWGRDVGRNGRQASSSAVLLYPGLSGQQPPAVGVFYNLSCVTDSHFPGRNTEAGQLQPVAG